MRLFMMFFEVARISSACVPPAPPHFTLCIMLLYFLLPLSRPSSIHPTGGQPLRLRGGSAAAPTLVNNFEVLYTSNARTSIHQRGMRATDIRRAHAYEHTLIQTDVQITGPIHTHTRTRRYVQMHTYTQKYIHIHTNSTYNACACVHE